MPEYKLTYFDLTALGEPIRWILKYVKADFEDERISFENWLTEKPRFPLGQVPEFIEDGKRMTQSAAIVRYLAKKYGLNTGDDWLDFRVDQVTEIVTDGRLQVRTYIIEQDEGKKEEIKKNLLANTCPKVLKQLNDIVSDHGGPFIAGSKVTYGDFVLANWLQIWVKLLTPNLLDGYPALTKQLEAVLNIPQIKQWVEERPKTRF